MTAFNSITELNYKVQLFGISFIFNITILKNITKMKLLFSNSKQNTFGSNFILLFLNNSRNSDLIKNASIYVVPAIQSCYITST